MSNGTYVCGQCGDVADNDHPCDCCCMAGPGPRAADVDALIASARNHVMTDAEREAQRQSWARGQSTPGPRQAVVVEPDSIGFISPMYLAACVAAERERVLAQFEALTAAWRGRSDFLVTCEDRWERGQSAGHRDCAAASDALIAKLRSNTADAQDEKETP